MVSALPFWIAAPHRPRRTVADAALAPAGAGGAAPLPLNRIPFMRAAIADKIVIPPISYDGRIALLDCISRSVDSGRCAACSDGCRCRSSRPRCSTEVFSSKKHPARRLLDHLAAASIGATGDAEYCVAFELLASGIIEEICRDFKVDMAVFEAADARLQEFVDIEQRKVSATLDTEVVQALDSERSESGRAHVRVLIRDKLAGLEVPFDVRLRRDGVGQLSDRAARARGRGAPRGRRCTIRELLWSISAKERTAQKARLAKLVPSIIRNLRAGAAAVKVAGARPAILGTIYQCTWRRSPRVAGARRRRQRRDRRRCAAAGARGTVPASGAAGAHPISRLGRWLPRRARSGEAAAVRSGRDARRAERRIGGVHDFVNEMVVGTKPLAGRQTINPVSWVSPLRSKYIFTSRARSKAIVVTPEELAWQLGAGKASLVVEPVPLFDRAVSAALDSIAAARPAAASTAAAAAPA
jgi:hypothetical protein